MRVGRLLSKAVGKFVTDWKQLQKASEPMPDPEDWFVKRQPLYK